MSFYHLITILSLALLNQTSHSFKPPKHNIISYYKTVNNVFLTNPENHTTSYGIYVAGETTTVDIPSDVANVYDIVNWKVVNVDKDRLMFVHNNKPQILIDQKGVKKMEYFGELSDSVISLGDNEALHVPTIFNPNLTEPVPEWNYIELLHFDVKNESVRVIGQRPFVGFFITKKSHEIMFFNFNLICAELNSCLDCVMYGFLFNCVWSQETPTPHKCIYDDQPKNKTALTVNHCFKMRYCTNITEHLMLNGLNDYNNKPQIVIDQKTIEDMEFSGELSDSTIAFGDNEASHFPSIFNPELTEPSYKWNYLELYFDVKSEKVSVIRYLPWLKDDYWKLTKKWKMTDYIHFDDKLSLLIKRSIWNEMTANVTQEISIIQLCINQGSELISSAVEVHHSKPEFQNSHIKDATFKLDLGLSYSPVYKSKLTSSGDRYYDFEHIDALNREWKALDNDVQEQFSVNQQPFIGFFITKVHHEIRFFNFNFLCNKMHNCFDCVMFDVYLNYVWPPSYPPHYWCIYDDKPVNKTALTFNSCFKVTCYYPSIFNSAVQQSLSIQLNTPLQIDDSKESLVTHAGPDNNCNNITMKDHNIQCSKNPLKSGKSNPEINLMNDKIADAKMISAVSTGMVHIILSESEHDYSSTIITSTTSIIIILSLCFYLCFTRSLVNKIGQPYSRYPRPRTDTSCNISMKLVSQTDLELTLIDDKQRIAVSETVMIIDSLSANIEVLLKQDISCVADKQIGCKDPVYDNEDEDSLPESWNGTTYVFKNPGGEMQGEMKRAHTNRFKKYYSSVEVIHQEQTKPEKRRRKISDNPCHEKKNPKSEPQKSPTSSAKVTNILCLMIILSILPTLNAFTKAPFITWRTSEKPIILGEISHHILIAMKSPCPKIGSEIRSDKREVVHLSNGFSIYRDSRADFENFQKITNQVCTQTTEDMVYETLKQLCSTKLRKKRRSISVIEDLFIGISAIVGVLNKVLPAYNFYTNRQQDEQINSIWVALDEQFRNDNVIIEALKNLTENQEKIANEMANMQLRFDQYLQYAPLSILTTSKIMMELSAIKQKLEMIEADIQKKRLNSNLLKMFNVTLPCGDSCPSDLARNFDCEFDNSGFETRKLKLTFDSAVINKNNTIFKADPFRLNEYNGSHYCTKTYVGPKYVFWREAMVCPFEQDDIENTDSTILDPSDYDCFQSDNTDLKDYWKTGNCVENLKKTNIQIKISKEELYIYCFNENITVFGITKACPIYPFRLGRDVSFKIGKRSYDAKSLRITVNTLETLKINLMLDSEVDDFNLKPVSVNLTTVDFVPNLRSSSEPFNLQIVIGILIIILLVCVYCLCRSKKPKYHRYLQPLPKNVDNSLV